MKVAYFTGWGGTWIVPVLYALMRSDLDIVGIFSQEVYWKRLHTASPNYYLNYRNNIEEILIHKGFHSKYKKINSVNDDENIELLNSLKPDLVILAGYGELLKKSFIEIPKKGVINVHPGKLPEKPGIDPISPVFTKKEMKYGVSLHFVDEGVDSGPIISFKENEFNPVTSSRTELEYQIGNTAAELIMKLIHDLQDGQVIEGKKQEISSTIEIQAKNSNRLINLEESVENICSFINAYSYSMSPATLNIHDRLLEVNEAIRINSWYLKEGQLNGSVLDVGHDYILLNTLDAPVLFRNLQLKDQSKQVTSQWLNHHIKIGQNLL